MEMNQVQMFYQAHRQIADRDAAFVEITNGPNPLTKAEIAKLIAKDPIRYSRYAKFAA
jgi:hypothetical protein